MSQPTAASIVKNGSFVELSPKVRKPLAPGPKWRFLVGEMPRFRNDVLSLFEDCLHTYGDLAQIYLGPMPVLVASHPEMFQDVLVRHRKSFSKMSSRRGAVSLKLALGKGLFTSTGDLWLKQKRMMQPIFQRKHLRRFDVDMVGATQRMLNRWNTLYTPEDTVDLGNEMMRVTLDIVCTTMFSADVTEEAEVIGESINTATHFIANRAASMLRTPLWWPTKDNRAFREAVAAADRVIYRVIKSRTEQNATNGDLLDLLLHAKDKQTGEEMSAQQLRDEVATIFAAGHETTSNALTWAWYLLGQHPEALAKLREEVDRVLGERAPTDEDLPLLSYTRQVFEETLRLCPSAPFLARFVDRDMNFHGHFARANSLIFLPLHNLHRHPEFWDEPERFMPERFAPEHKDTLDRNAFLPFSTGARVCIGNHFAMMEGQILLAMMVQQYDIRPAPGHRVIPEVAITLRPKNKMLVNLQPRALAVSPSSGS